MLYKTGGTSMQKHTSDNPASSSVSRGISIRQINYFMAFLVLIISVVLLLSTYRTNSGYDEMRQNTENYISWQQSAYDLQIGSDYLTEQVRCFTETGDRQYLDNYFKEANVTQRRDKALESVQQIFGDSPAAQSLEAAMAQSVILMDREYYAMRLTVEAYGYDLAEFPREIRNVGVDPADAALPPAEKEARARDMVFDSTYYERKNAISGHMRNCLSELAQDVEGDQSLTSDALHTLLSHQQILIILAIAISLLTMILNLLLVVSPLLRSVMFIRAEKPIPITGSSEFQFLAKTYNLMYEANLEKREHLAFEATHDKLTGVYNRSGYDFLLTNLDLATSALLVFDLDKFKSINDTYGHEVGDAVLVRTAQVLRANFRDQDFVCRLGGDEFAVIMVHVRPNASELIRGKVAHINRTLRRAEGPTATVSCGAAYGLGVQDIEEFFRRADAALYQAKARGGCDCEVTDTDPMETVSL